MKTARCSSCDAEIIWARSDRGNAVPIVAEPSPKGNIRLVGDSPRAVYLTRDLVAAASAQGEQLYLSHFADCPFAGQHRKKQT